MAAIYLTEDDVAWLADMESAIECVGQAFLALGDGRAAHQPRRRVSAAGTMLHSMSAAAEYLGYVGFKAYTTTRTSARFHVMLYDAESGEPAALFEANQLGQIRTGAASGVATRCMARPDARVVGCFGTGFQAKTQLKAMCCVRRIERIEVYGRDGDRRKAFAEEMTEFCGVPTVAVHSPEECAAEKDIIVCATTSKTPVFDGRAIDEGTHINAVGSNWLGKAEIDTTVIRRADHIACDSVEACQLEAGDFVPALEAGVLEWGRVHELHDVLAGRETGRAHPPDITLFKSVGIALEDVALAVRLLQRARDEKVGQALPF